MQPGFTHEQTFNPLKGYENLLIQYNYKYLNIVLTGTADESYAKMLFSNHTVAIFKINWK